MLLKCRPHACAMARGVHSSGGAAAAPSGVGGAASASQAPLSLAEIRTTAQTRIVEREKMSSTFHGSSKCARPARLPCAK